MVTVCELPETKKHSWNAGPLTGLYVEGGTSEMELTVGPTVDIMRYFWRLIEKNCERNYAIEKGRSTWNTMDKFKNNL